MSLSPSLGKILLTHLDLEPKDGIAPLAWLSALGFGNVTGE